MAKRAELSGERLRGIDAVLSGPRGAEEEREPVKMEPEKVVKGEKRKITLRLSLEGMELLEELRYRLRREQGLPPSVASKSAIVEAALRLAGGDLSELAKLLSGAA